jgi:hypothetical protein
MAWTTPGTATAGEVLTASFWNTQVRDNMVELAPFMASWTAWTPSLQAGFGNGNATRTGGYIKIGKMCIFWAKIVFGSTTTKGDQMNVTLPFTALASDSGLFFATAIDITANWFHVWPIPTSTTALEIVSSAAGGTYTQAAQTKAAVPFTWDTGDVVRYQGVYEIA